MYVYIFVNITRIRSVIYGDHRYLSFYVFTINNSYKTHVRSNINNLIILYIYKNIALKFYRCIERYTDNALKSILMYASIN